MGDVDKASAISLMRDALAILDALPDDKSLTACHLQAAIDCATGALPLRAGEMLDPDLIDRVLGPRF
jgi:hypothetical protein